MYLYPTQLKLRDTDATGFLYYPGVFNLAQEALETFLTQQGQGLDKLLDASPYGWPVVHAEADFDRPLRAGTPLQVTLCCTEIGQTSFQLSYHVTDPSGEIRYANARIVHVVVDRRTGNKQSIPDDVRALLETIRPAAPSQNEGG